MILQKLKRKKSWNPMDMKRYKLMLEKELSIQRAKMVDYIKEVIKDAIHPGEDNREILQLSVPSLMTGLKANLYLSVQVLSIK